MSIKSIPVKATVLLLGFTAFPEWGSAQCDSFQMDLTISNPTCYNYSDGNIHVTTTGGTPPVSGTVTNEDGVVVDVEKKTFSLMGGGWYYIYVVDANGCELYDSVYLVNPPEMIAEMTITDPSYPGACDGMAVVDTVLNYQGSFNDIGYFWSPGGPYGPGQNVKTDLCDANYNLVINDAYGCYIIEYMAIGSVSVEEANPDAEILLFPNPFTDAIYVKGVMDGTVYAISNTAGQVVQTGVVENQSIVNLGELKQGTYFLVLNLETGIQVYSLMK